MSSHPLWVRVGALLLALTTAIGAGMAFVSVVSGPGDAEPIVDLAPDDPKPLTEEDRTVAALLPDGPLDGLFRSDIDAGPLDLADAAAEYPFGDPDGTRLKASGFVRGHARGWKGTDGRTAHVVVFELRDPDGFMTAWQAAAAELADGRFSTTVGDGIRDTEGDSEASLVAWVEGTYWYYVVHFGPDAAAGDAAGDGADHVRTIVAAVLAS